MLVRHPRSVIITEDFYVLGGESIIQVPGCICAFFDYGLVEEIVYCVVHEDDKTKILLGVNNNGEFIFKTVLERDEIIDIINISAYLHCGETKYMFSSYEGVRFVLDKNGKRKRLDDEIPTNSVSVLSEISPRIAVDDDGQISSTIDRCIITTVDGYCQGNTSRVIAWRRHKIFEIDTETESIYPPIKLDYPKNIDDVYVHQFYDDILPGKTIVDITDMVVFILSGRHIHIKLLHRGEIIRSYKLRGKWISAPFCVNKCLCAIDICGVIRDIRSAWDEYSEFALINDEWKNTVISPDMLHSTDPSLYVQGIKLNKGGISICHGMEVSLGKW